MKDPRHSVWPSVVGLAMAAAVARAPAIGAQQPAPVPSPPPQPAAGQLPPYRPPTIALVQPPNGTMVPQDKPVVVFRFTQGEPGDLIDLASFAVAIDGRDRTALFQVTAGEAWGPLGPPVTSPNDTSITPGIHQVTARICSARGACGEASTSVSVVPAAASSPAAADAAPARRRKLVDAVLTVLRKLLVP